MTELQPWQWDEPTWRGHVERVRAGVRLVPPQWPDGARVAVAISFDPDHETIPLRDGETRPGKLSQGEYGARAAVPRILALLAEHRVPASFFMPAVSALLHPGEVEAYVAGGHEVGVHGWIHERNMLLDPAARAAGGVFQLTLHPHVIGHRSRLVVLRELLAHIAGHSDVWFATHAEIAELARAQLQPVTVGGAP
jgi:Polysaccharide deacetylase